MASKFEPENSKNNSSVLVFIISFLLLVSIAISVIGILNGKKEENINSRREDTELQDKTEEKSLTDLFEKNFTEQRDARNGYDPFKETCSSVEGVDSAAITSYTVCYH